MKQRGEYTIKKKYILVIVIIILCFVLIACKNEDTTIKDITAESYGMAYEDSVLYFSNDTVDKTNVKSLVEKYNNIKLIGKSKEQVSWEKSIGILFYYKNHISGQIYLFDNGICSFNGLDMYTMSDETDIYEDALYTYKDLKEKQKQ